MMMHAERMTPTVKFTNSMFRLSLCDYNDACIFVKGTISVVNRAGTGNAANNDNKKGVFNLILLHLLIA